MATLTKPQAETIELTGATALRTVLALLLSAAGGIMLLLAFQPYGLWPLAWIGFVPHLIAQHRIMPRRLSMLAPAVGVGIWLGIFFLRLFPTDAPLVLQYLGILIGLGMGLGTINERSFHESTGYRWFVLQGVFNWVGIEMVRGMIEVTNTTVFMGYSMALQPWGIQLASIFGIFGLNLLVMFFNYTVAYLIIGLIDRMRQDDPTAVKTRRAAVWFAATAVAAVLWLGGSALMLNAAPQDADTIRVAALQPYLETPGHLVDEAQQEERLQIILGQAREAAEQGAQVILTPELAFGFDPQVEHTDEFEALAAETGAYIFISYGLHMDEGWRNEVVMISPEGEFGDIYGKNHVMGEPRIMSAGAYVVNETPLGNLAALICHDGNFTDTTRRLVRNGAQLVGDASFEWPGFSEHKYTHDVFRAVENRVAFIKSDSSYSSAIIDPYGRLLSLGVLKSGGQQVLVEDVPLGTGQPTLYTRLGDWLGWVSLAGLVGFMVYMPINKRRAKKNETH